MTHDLLLITLLLITNYLLLIVYDYNPFREPGEPFPEPFPRAFPVSREDADKLPIQEPFRRAFPGNLTVESLFREYEQTNKQTINRGGIQKVNRNAK